MLTEERSQFVIYPRVKREIFTNIIHIAEKKLHWVICFIGNICSAFLIPFQNSLRFTHRVQLYLHCKNESRSLAGISLHHSIASGPWSLPPESLNHININTAHSDADFSFCLLTYNYLIKKRLLKCIITLWQSYWGWEERERSNSWVTVPAGQFNFQTMNNHTHILLPADSFLKFSNNLLNTPPICEAFHSGNVSGGFRLPWQSTTIRAREDWTQICTGGKAAPGCMLPSWTRPHRGNYSIIGFFSSFICSLAVRRKLGTCTEIVTEPEELSKGRGRHLGSIHYACAVPNAMQFSSMTETSVWPLTVIPTYSLPLVRER